MITSQKHCCMREVFSPKRSFSLCLFWWIKRAHKFVIVNNKKGENSNNLNVWLWASLGDCRPALQEGWNYQMVKTQTESHDRRPIVWTNRWQIWVSFSFAVCRFSEAISWLIWLLVSNQKHSTSQEVCTSTQCTCIQFTDWGWSTH